MTFRSIYITENLTIYSGIYHYLMLIFNIWTLKLLHIDIAIVTLIEYE